MILMTGSVKNKKKLLFKSGVELFAELPVPKAEN